MKKNSVSGPKNRLRHLIDPQASTWFEPGTGVRLGYCDAVVNVADGLEPALFVAVFEVEDCLLE